MEEKLNLIESSTVVLDLRLSTMSFRKGMTLNELTKDLDLDDESEERRPDPAFVAISKYLIDRKELRGIRSLDVGIKRRLKQLSVPSSFLRPGFYRVPKSLVVKVDEELKEFETSRQALVLEDLVEPYDRIKEEARKKLKSNFDETQYPTVQQIASGFDVSYCYLRMNIPEDLVEVDVDLIRIEREKAQQALQEEFQTINAALELGLSKMIDEMVNRLTPSADGKDKQFRESSVQRFKEFVELLGARNITNNEKVKELADRAKDVLSGVSIVQLKVSTDKRSKVLGVFEEVQKELDQLEVVKKSKRRVMT